MQSRAITSASAYEVDELLQSLKYTPAMEMTATELVDVIGGRKEVFNQFYPTVVKGMRSNSSKFIRAVNAYEDRNVEILASPYLLNYTLFGDEDKKVIWDVTGVKRDDVEEALTEMKLAIRDGCRSKGYKEPASLFVNVTSERVILLLIIRYYLERGDKAKLEKACAYAGYSMFFTIFRNFFWYPIRKETMIYTINNMTKKHKLRNLESIGALLTYGIMLCTTTYKQKIMDCTDIDITYVIGQWKSRLRGYFKDIANQYHTNDAKKEAIFTSIEKIEGEEGTDYVERDSKSGVIEQTAQQYTTRFFQKPIDDEIIQLCSKMNEVSKQEIKNALTMLRSDKARIPEVKAFYEALFYLYSQETESATFDVHSKKFMAVMDSIYRKGNSKEKNIVQVKKMLDSWLTATSQTYRDATRNAKINDYRRSIYQYFVFSVALRR